MDISEISLREKKHANTKLAIMKEFVNRLETMHFEDIPISEVCASAEVSGGTFFNYFPKKIDVFYYYKSYMFLLNMWKVEQQLRGKKTLRRIDMILETLIESIPSSNFLNELMIIFIREGSPETMFDMTEAEKIIAFPDCSGIEKIPVMTMEQYFKRVIEEAIHNGELHKDTNIEELSISFLAVLCGTILALPKEKFGDRKRYLQRHLLYIWKSIGRNIK